MTPPIALFADGGAEDADSVPHALLALRDRALRPVDPAVARRHVAAAAALAAAGPEAGHTPRHLRQASLDDFIPGGARTRKATSISTRVSAVAAAVVIGTAGLAAAQILPRGASTITSVIRSIPNPWADTPQAEPARPADLPVRPQRSGSAPVATDRQESEDSTTSSSDTTTSTVDPTTSTTADPTTSTTVDPSTTTTEPGDGTVDGTEQPTTSTTVPDDGTVEGTEQPTTTSTTSTTVPGDGAVEGTEVPTTVVLPTMPSPPTTPTTETTAGGAAG